MPRSPLAAAALLAALLLVPAARADSLFPAENRDTTCAPCRDFDQFANGGWRSRFVMPAAYSRYGAFTEVADRNQEVLLGIVTRDAAKQAKPGSDEAKLGDYWTSCMDSTAAEQAGLAPVQPLLTAVDGMTSTADLGRQVAWFHAHGVGTLFTFSGNQDAKHSDRFIAHAGQGGLGLPDRDYYTKQDSASRALRTEYVAHMARVFGLAGEEAGAAAKHADDVMALETALANASMTNVQRRDPFAIYHVMPADSLVLLAPRFGWKDYFAGRMKNPDIVNVTQPDFFRAVNVLIGTVPLDTWKAYLKWAALADAAPTLTKAFGDEDFRFEKLLTGAKEQQPRWKRCLGAVDRDLGDMLGKAYVAETFPPKARARALGMVHNLEAALGDKIAGLAWMSEDTRKAAAGKLAAFDEKIGYPDKWRDYSGVKITRGPLFANRLEARAAESARNMDRVGKPVERREWRMTPPTVNAFYSAQLNSINFPAGILQPPFFYPDADDPVIYGAIGAVIGHEMTHGFDDRGRQFDAQGNLRDWWKPADADAYKVQAQRVVEQFDGYTVNDTLHVNGKLTLGENIADLGGLAVAYAAMQKALAGKPRKRIDGFTPEQRFFLAYARIWRAMDRPEGLRTRVLTDSHSPAHWRVNGPLSNLKEFRDAWGCKDGDGMVRDSSQRASIW
ncbi:MAG TPA: M13 family metallopeptidase [Candidatus Eisenbacteria bacterium]|jgi:predicted metalloendopeptidase